MNDLDVGFIGLVLLGGLALWAVWKFHGLAFIYDIRLTSEGTEFVLFSALTMGFVSFSTIKSIQETNGGYLYWRAYNFKNRFGHTTFLIDKKKGIFSGQVLVTPDDADEFTRALTHAGVPVARRRNQGNA